MHRLVLLIALLLLPGCWAATRNTWIGEERLVEVSSSAGFASMKNVIFSADGSRAWKKVREPIENWTIPFRVMATPLAVVADIILPFIFTDDN